MKTLFFVLSIMLSNISYSQVHTSSRVFDGYFVSLSENPSKYFNRILMDSLSNQEIKKALSVNNIILTFEFDILTHEILDIEIESAISNNLKAKIKHILRNGLRIKYVKNIFNNNLRILRKTYFLVIEISKRDKKRLNQTVPPIPSSP